MARKQLLCLASGTGTRGNLRAFSVYKLRGETFEIHNDRGHEHISHSSRRVVDRDIKDEIGVVYDVSDIRLEGNVQEGLLASTWPASCDRCRNCKSAPTRRAYGGRGYCVLSYSLMDATARLKAW